MYNLFETVFSFIFINENNIINEILNVKNLIILFAELVNLILFQIFIAYNDATEYYLNFVPLFDSFYSKKIGNFLNLKFIGVEFFLFIAIFIIFIFSLLKSVKSAMLMQINIIYLSILSLILCVFILNNTIMYDYSLCYYNHFFNNHFLIFIKQLICFIIIIIFILGLKYVFDTFIITYEFSIILLISVWSMFLLIGTIDLIGIYLIIELQSFCFYILTATKSKSNFSTEAALKYFILGSVSSALLLFGISILYGITGLTNLNELKIFFFNISNEYFIFNNIIIFSLILVLVSLLFKFGLFPFHMYVPDVYTGAPTIVTTLFLVIQKLIILLVFLNMYNTIFIYYYNNLNLFIIISIIGSIILGSITALAQSKIKRLFAYSAIVNGGFLLIGLVVGTIDGFSSSILFLLIYISLILNLFTIYISVNFYYNNHKLVTFKDLILLKKGNLLLAICLSLILFSIAGIPPLAGFFGKLFLFISAIKEGLYLISIISILFTVITAFYYIILIKIMFFEKELKFGFFKSINKFEAYIISLSTIFNLLFFITPKLLFIYINLLLLNLYLN
jgi:NADH-quinone oxidoreductase subunit N